MSLQGENYKKYKKYKYKYERQKQLILYGGDIEHDLEIEIEFLTSNIEVLKKSKILFVPKIINEIFKQIKDKYKQWISLSVFNNYISRITDITTKTDLNETDVGRFIFFTNIIKNQLINKKESIERTKIMSEEYKLKFDAEISKSVMPPITIYENIDKSNNLENLRMDINNALVLVFNKYNITKINGVTIYNMLLNLSNYCRNKLGSSSIDEYHNAEKLFMTLQNNNETLSDIIKILLSVIIFGLGVRIRDTIRAKTNMLLDEESIRINEGHTQWICKVMCKISYENYINYTTSSDEKIIKHLLKIILLGYNSLCRLNMNNGQNTNNTYQHIIVEPNQNDFSSQNNRVISELLSNLLNEHINEHTYYNDVFITNETILNNYKIKNIVSRRT